MQTIIKCSYETVEDLTGPLLKDGWTIKTGYVLPVHVSGSSYNQKEIAKMVFILEKDEHLKI